MPAEGISIAWQRYVLFLEILTASCFREPIAHNNAAPGVMPGAAASRMNYVRIRNGLSRYAQRLVHDSGRVWY